jgi:hypothetical protein
MSRLKDFRARATAALSFNADAGARGWAGAVDRTNAGRDASMRPTLSARGDGAAMLPVEARQKLDGLRERRDELLAIARDLGDKCEAARLEKIEFERALRHMRDADVAGHLNDDDPRVLRARERIAAADAELRRFEDRRDARTAEWTPLGQLIDATERWLQSLPGDAVIEPAEVETPKLLKGETPSAAVDRLRRKRRDLIADLAQVEAAPITSTTARALVKAEVEALAARGRPDLYGTIEHAEPIRWPESRISAPLVGFAQSEGQPMLQGTATAKVSDALALIAWMYRDDLLAALDAEVDAVADDAAALTDDERAARKADILTSVLEYERAEVALIDEIGGAVAFRPDTDPRALLAVTGPAPQEA